MNIVVGSDHAGFHLKEAIKKHLLSNGYEVLDVGIHDEGSCNYPDYAIAAAEKVAKGEAKFGILCCGSAEGISIAANKVKGVRCGIGYNDEVSGLMREHNDANMIAFAERFMDEGDVMRRVDIFLSTAFAGGRHQNRVNLITEYEKNR